MTVLAALGDSFTCGEGVGVRVDPAATWTALLAAALPGGRLVRLATPGARVADVRARQLPLLPDRVDVATLLVGLNDVARAGFDPCEVAVDLRSVVGVLRERADDVLLGRLHDAPSLLPLPARVRTSVRGRIAAVNAVVDDAAGTPGVHVLDLAQVPALGSPGGWAVDRIHPGPAGHRGMAASAARELRRRGRHVPAPVPVGTVPRGASPCERGWWALRHAAPYAAGHLGELGRPMASAVLRGR